MRRSSTSSWFFLGGLILLGTIAASHLFAAGPPEQEREELFRVLDKNKDGVLDKEEIPAKFRATIQGSDADKNQVISLKEFSDLLEEEQKPDYGAYSLLPAVVALVLAYLTGQVLLALFMGVVTGGVVVFFQSGNFGDLNIINTFFIPALGSASYAQILLVYLWFLGGILGIWGKTGAARHFAETIGGRIAKGPKSSKLFAWLVGCIFHQGGTVSTVLAGTTVKPVSDRHRISHEELSYIVDSTASPVATVLPFNVWPAYIGGLIAGTTLTLTLAGGDEVSFPLIETAKDGIGWFFSSIFFNFYGMIAVLFTLLFALDLLPWVGGRMRRAIVRSRETGRLDSEKASPVMDTSLLEQGEYPGYRTTLVDFLVPLGILLGLAIIPILFFGTSMINEAFMLSTLSAIVIAIAKKMPAKEVMDGFLGGCKNMTIGAIILGLAVTLGLVSKQLGTADFLTETMQGVVQPWMLPLGLTLTCMIIAFSIGSSFGTYALVFPVAIPLAFSFGLQRVGVPLDGSVMKLAETDPAAWASVLFYVKVCFGAVIGGSVFGDQCSPISDTTILSSMFTGCDVMDHVRTQMPLALLAAGLGGLLSTLLVLIF